MTSGHAPSFSPESVQFSRVRLVLASQRPGLFAKFPRLLIESLKFIGDLANAILDSAQLSYFAGQTVNLFSRLFMVGEELLQFRHAEPVNLFQPLDYLPAFVFSEVAVPFLDSAIG